MDKWEGLQSFWESFGIPAYDENTVPDDAVMPYITYQAAVGSFEDTVPLSASIWYKSMSWSEISQKADEISRRLNGWTLVNLGNHQYIYLKKNRDSQFAQRMADEASDLIRRVYLSLSAEFFTEH